MRNSASFGGKSNFKQASPINLVRLMLGSPRRSSDIHLTALRNCSPSGRILIYHPFKTLFVGCQLVSPILLLIKIKVVQGSVSNVVSHNYHCAKLFPFSDEAIHKLSDDPILFLYLDSCPVFYFFILTRLIIYSPSVQVFLSC